MDPVTVSTTISRPREEVFEYLVDIANHAEFTDHFLTDWRLTRVDSYGQGAGARFRMKAPMNRFAWHDVTFIDVNPGQRIVAAGRGGKYNRVKTWWTWELSPAGGGGATLVEMTAETEPALPSDRLAELFSGRGWFKRRSKRALARLRSILEEGSGRGKRASVAGL